VPHIGQPWLSNVRISGAKHAGRQNMKSAANAALRLDDQPTSVSFWRRAQRGAYRPAMALERAHPRRLNATPPKVGLTRVAARPCSRLQLVGSPQAMGV
jgi:hypothetical protein